MGKPETPVPVKLFVGVLYAEGGKLDSAVELLSTEFGAPDYQSEPFVFDGTDYYEPEMGADLKRAFVSFERLIPPDQLAAVKLKTNDIEEQLSTDGRRTVNLDVGYLDFNKVVLASTKVAGPKIYLADGIYADMTLRYEKGKFFAYDWAFLDFRSGLYDACFLRIREKYKAALKLQRKPGD